MWSMFNLNPPSTMQRTPVSQAFISLRAMRSQSGFSLVELMVGITVGLLVVLAAIGSLAFTQASSTVVVDSAGLQQKADAIFRNISYHVEQAGANNVEPAGDPAKIIFSAGFTGFNPAVTNLPGQIVSIHGEEGKSNAPDILRVSYQNDGNVRDCMGNRLNAVTVPTFDNQFSVNNGSLMCLGADASVPEQAIDVGVEDFQVTYGVQTFVGGAAQYQYFPADPGLNWTNIQAVSICLQLAGDTQGNPRVGPAFKGCRDQNVANDGKIRRLFRRTISIRNALL